MDRLVHPFPFGNSALGNSAGISIKRNALPGILTEVLLFLNPDECAKIKPIRAEGKGENHVYDCRTGESRERI